jgi:hypothetical protein
MERYEEVKKKMVPEAGTFLNPTSAFFPEKGAFSPV